MMFPQTLLALLMDESNRLLLVRRKGSVLWTLPGGVVRGPVDSRAAFLASCCTRQVGVTPDFVASFAEFVFVGDRVAISADEIPAERARACGRIEASTWFPIHALPMELLPVACMAIAIHVRSRAERGWTRAAPTVPAAAVGS